MRPRHLFGVLGAEVLRGSDHVAKRCLRLLPLSSLQATVWVDPELVRLEVRQHLLNAVLNLLLCWDTRAVNVIDT